ncbi:hypothetical protein JTB14_027524 [Gonioctena quinquepunctata]|nr:hypothetical protein JTB14_027524 [Gonioctena quinquepunctata]
MNYDSIGTLNPESFKCLNRVNYLSLADNNLEEIPDKLWKEMPKIGTLDLGRIKIKNIFDNSFSGLPNLKCLVLPGNQISHVDSNSIPKQIQRVHLGRNYMRDLNDSLKNLPQLGWLFINSNSLTNLDGQLPRSAPNLKMIHASNNNLENLPAQLKNYPLLDSVFFEKNRLKALDGAVSKCDRLMRLALDYNEISTLTEDDFEGTTLLTSLPLGYNGITTLNNSLIHPRNLNFLNLTFNQFVEFSLQEDQPLIWWNIKLNEIKLDHNPIESLIGAFSGSSELLRLNLRFNKLKKISPEDLIGLEQLRLLDVSHNQLTYLEETSETYLPRLSELKASDLKILEKDFHGLPVLCHADLSNNQIVALCEDLVAKTRCTIEHGVHEGTWDTLRIYLQDNPILCDAALPDTMSIMEINHTRIYGVSHCPPLSEQPTTSKPNGFFGYIPETWNFQKIKCKCNVKPSVWVSEPIWPKKLNTRSMTMLLLNIILLSMMVQGMYPWRYYYKNNGDKFDIVMASQAFGDYRELKAPKTQKMNQEKRGERPGVCVDRFDCYVPYQRFSTESFECTFDYQCPRYYKCCQLSCFVHKVCQPAIGTEVMTTSSAESEATESFEPTTFTVSTTGTEITSSTEMESTATQGEPKTVMPTETIPTEITVPDGNSN